ncbi:hypothetical protein ABEB36_004504 [Hypothenemus hampei]
MLDKSWIAANVIVRIWVASVNYQTKKISGKWKLLYLGPHPKAPKGLFYQFPDLINVMRIEFNNKLGKHFPKLAHFQVVTTDLELVLTMPLIVDIPSNHVMYNGARRLTYKKIRKKKSEGKLKKKKNVVKTLSTEILLKIFDYLDLVSLSRCAQVNKRWNAIANDESFYQEIDLKMYWNKVNSDTLSKLKKNLGRVKKLDMTWCNQDRIEFRINNLCEDFHNLLVSILGNTKDTLTHLCLDHNVYVTIRVVEVIASCSNLQELRLRNTYNWVGWKLENLSITKLKTLDVSMTNVTEKELITILKNNPNLEHLVIDYCRQLTCGIILDTVITHNPNLKAWSSWDAFEDQDNSKIYARFGELVHLEDLDLGLCAPTTYKIHCLEIIVTKCKKLKRLIVTSWKLIKDQEMLPVVIEGKELIQLNIARLYKLTPLILSVAVDSLPNLRYLNIQHCCEFSNELVERYIKKYPNLEITYKADKK